MIQANEVRIENWVNTQQGWGKIRTIEEGDEGEFIGIVSNDTGSVWLRLPYDGEINPIPLTPEILESCGFEKYTHEPGYAIGSDEKNERCNEYSKGKLSIMDWGNGFFLSNSFSFDLRIELNHLHQLQNLYFALTGKELEIKNLEPNLYN